MNFPDLRFVSCCLIELLLALEWSFRYSNNRKTVPSLICATQEFTTSRIVLISMSYRQNVHKSAIFAKCK